MNLGELGWPISTQDVHPQLLRRIVLGAATATVTFTEIPQNFSHLRLSVVARGDTAATSARLEMQFNNDTGSNYDSNIYQFDHLSTNSVVESLASAQIQLTDIPAASAVSGDAGVSEVRIFDYAGNTFNKACRLSGFMRYSASSGDQREIIATGHWRSTNPITAITLFLSAGNFVSGSSFTLQAGP